jgi:hypothetical protein
MGYRRGSALIKGENMFGEKEKATPVKPGVVRCKFCCSSVRKHVDSGSQGTRFLYNYEFHAVYAGSEENAKFFAYTPSGSLTIGSFRDDLFEPGKEYYIDIQPAVTQ